MDHDAQPGILRRIATRIGMFWYVVPSLFVVALGMATCNLIDELDFDRFEVLASVPDRSGVRSAVVVRQHYSNSSATVTCVWIIAGPPPRKGPSHRLAPSCALIATKLDQPIALSWLSNGRLLAKIPDDATALRGEDSFERCYFHSEELPRHVCYRPEMIDVAGGR